MIDPRTLKPYADGVSDGITVSEEPREKLSQDMDGSDPIPVIKDHELRLRKLEETLSFRAGNLAGKPAFTHSQMESIIATKHPVFQLPSDDELHRLGGLMEQQKMTQRLAQKVCEVQRATEEDHIRAELIRLGWTPPDSKAEDSVRPLPGSGPMLSAKVQEIVGNSTFTVNITAETESPAEPAPGSDQDHPPLGYRREPVGGWMQKGYLFWNGTGTWQHGGTLVGRKVSKTEFPIANPIPANEGDSRLAESVAIPVGWVASTGGKAYGGGWILPDPSIPWGEGYEAILPSEATEGDEYWSVDRWWKSGGGRCHPSVPGYFAWRRRIPATTPTEPARDLSAEVERLEAELRAMTERAENFGRALRSIAEYKGLYIDSEAFYATRKIARVAIANEGKKA